jgi:hypothetical protein
MLTGMIQQRGCNDARKRRDNLRELAGGDGSREQFEGPALSSTWTVLNKRRKVK